MATIMVMVVVLLARCSSQPQAPRGAQSSRIFGRSCSGGDAAYRRLRRPLRFCSWLRTGGHGLVFFAYRMIYLPMIILQLEIVELEIVQLDIFQLDIIQLGTVKLEIAQP